MYIYNFLIIRYAIELVYVTFYFFGSFFFCFLVSILKFHSLVSYVSVWILRITNKKLFVLDSLEIFNTNFFLSSNYSIFFALPLFLFFIFQFFSNGWYCKQIDIYFKMYFQFIFCLIVSFACSFFFLKSILFFLLYWSFDCDKSSYSIFDIHLTLFNYSYWCVTFNFKLLFLINFFYIFLLLINLVIDLVFFYNLLLEYKNIIFFVFCLLFSIFCFDVYMQVVLIFIFIFIYEICFFFLCYVNINLYFCGNIKTSIK